MDKNLSNSAKLKERPGSNWIRWSINREFPLDSKFFKTTSERITKAKGTLYSQRHGRLAGSSRALEYLYISWRLLFLSECPAVKLGRRAENVPFWTSPGRSILRLEKRKGHPLTSPIPIEKPQTTKNRKGSSQQWPKWDQKQTKNKHSLPKNKRKHSDPYKCQAKRNSFTGLKIFFTGFKI